MPVPAPAFVGYLKAVEPALPVARKGSAAESAKPALQLLDVAFGQVGHVPDGEHDVFRLADQTRPPLYGLAALRSQAGLAFGAVEAVAPVGKAFVFAAVAAEGNCPGGVAAFEPVGEVGPAVCAQFGGDGVFGWCLRPRIRAARTELPTL